jgi:hypothetical protein
MWEAGAFEGGVADDREIVERRVCLLTDNLLDRDCFRTLVLGSSLLIRRLFAYFALCENRLSYVI